MTEGKLPAEAVDGAEQRLRAGPAAWQFAPLRFVYSDFRLPQHLPRWREYRPGVRRHEELIRAGGVERCLLNENWPQERNGRAIGLQKLRIRLSRESITNGENGRTILEAAHPGVSFERADLHLQQSSHSNYPRREVFFHNVMMTRLPR